MQNNLLYQGVPTIIRSDCGGENSCLATCHMMLRHGHTDEYQGNRSFRYGPSTTNTVSDIITILARIIMIIREFESWWGQLRKCVSDYWINEFKVQAILHINTIIKITQYRI